MPPLNTAERRAEENGAAEGISFASLERRQSIRRVRAVNANQTKGRKGKRTRGKLLDILKERVSFAFGRMFIYVNHGTAEQLDGVAELPYRQTSQQQTDMYETYYNSSSLPVFVK